MAAGEASGAARLLLLVCAAAALWACAEAVRSDVRWSSDPEHLNVFVVPHSHNDPGWWYTYEEYYKRWTKGIISSVVTALDEDESRTFIWCETSFFSRWWKDQNSATKDIVKRLVRDKQLEFVGGGWVMNDEASVTLTDIVNQYTAGHQWLRKHIGPEAVPTTAWSIDPFGHSSAMAWAHREMGMEGMVINRVHRDTKLDWNRNQELEFSWERPWHMGNTSCVPGDAVPEISNGELSLTKPSGRQGERWEGEGMLTHMLAYKLYDIPNTCGPDWDVCATFDFERPVAVPITYKNVAERAGVLVDQYRRKAEAFQHNNLLVPLGDDFKYKNIEITRKMMSQYELLFEHINANPDMKVSIRYATLSEYFEAVKQSLPRAGLPRYDKDFFTYNDEGSDYWSGYYTTRPYLKKLVRTTGTALRSAQVLYNLAHSSDASSSHLASEREGHYAAIEQCSQTLGLLQHHDAITGTCRQVVANDYTWLLATSNAAVREVTSAAAGALLCERPAAVRLLHVEAGQQDKNDGAEESLRISVVSGEEGHVVTFFNPLARPARKMAHVLLNTPMVEVVDLSVPEGRLALSQASPSFVEGRPTAGAYRVHFQANVPAFGLASYLVRHSSDDASRAVMADVYSSAPGQRLALLGETLPLPQGGEELFLENEYYSLRLAPTTGQPLAVTLWPEGRAGQALAEMDLEHRYKVYRSRSGAYLFKPSAAAEALGGSVEYTVVKGPLMHEAVSRVTDKQLSLATRVFRSSLPSVAMAIEMAHSLDISDRMYNNLELISEIRTGLRTGGTYFTDGNGLDMIERNWDPQMPIQANFYPISSAVSMPGERGLLTLLSRQGVGVGSVEEDVFQVMLDRRTMQDDGRGMGEKVTDNASLEERFLLVLQPPGAAKGTLHPRASTPLTRSLQAQLEYPLEALHAPLNQWAAAGCSVAPLALADGEQLEEGVEVFSFQPTSAEENVALLRLSHLSQGGPPGPARPMDIASFLLPGARIRSAKEVTLASMHVVDHAADVSSVVVPRMAVRSFLLELAPPSVSHGRRELPAGQGQQPQPLQPPPLQRPAPEVPRPQRPMPQAPIGQQERSVAETWLEKSAQLRGMLDDRNQAEAELQQRIDASRQQQRRQEEEAAAARRGPWDVPGQQHEPIQLQPVGGIVPRALQPAPPRLQARPMERTVAPKWLYFTLFLLVIVVATAWMCKLLCGGTHRPYRRTKSRREVV